MVKHIQHHERKKRKSPRITATAWCGYKAVIGEWVSNTRTYFTERITELERVLYSDTFKPRLIPEHGFDVPFLSDCLDCRKAFKGGSYV